MSLSQNPTLVVGSQPKRAMLSAQALRCRQVYQESGRLQRAANAIAHANSDILSIKLANAHCAPGVYPLEHGSVYSGALALSCARKESKSTALLRATECVLGRA